VEGGQRGEVRRIEESPSRMRLPLVVLLIALMIFGVYLWESRNEVPEPEPAEAVPEASRPSMTARGRAAPAPAAGPPLGAEAKGDVVEISVILTEDNSWKPDITVISLFDPASFWPTPDEAPLPDIASAAALEATMVGDLSREEGNTRIQAFLDAAESDDLDPTDIGLLESPWTALIAIEAARIRHLLEWMEAMNTHDWESKAPMPKVETGDVLELALSIEQLDPDAPVADFARLYILDAQRNEAPEDAVDLALGILESSGDALVAEEAVRLIAAHHDVPLEGEDLDLLGRQFDDIADPNTRLFVARIGVAASSRNADLRQLKRWVRRHEAAAGESESDVLDGERAAINGLVAARGGREVTTWKGALVAEIWRCHKRGESLSKRKLEGTGDWDAGWKWSAWTDDPPLATCLKEASVEIEPKEPVTVDVWISR